MENWISQEAILLETNIDNMNPQLYGGVMDLLFEKGGAMDVSLIPIQMKKNRPGVLLSVLCTQDRYDDCMRIIFSETSTLGIRKRQVECIGLQKEVVWFETSLGRVRVKVAQVFNTTRYFPEYDDCNEIAKNLEMPLIDILKIIENEIDKKFKGNFD